MSEKKHTPGPWYPNSQDDAVYAEDPIGGIVALSPEVEGYMASSERWTANAHLIAAAPEMLEALEALLDVQGIIDPTDDECQQIDDAVRMAETAIKKARGES